MLSTTNPYFTADGISRTFDLYYKTTRPYDAQGGDYEISTPASVCASGCHSPNATPSTSVWVPSA
ncbi:Ribosomal protein S2 [Hydrogenophaga sp. T4]|nr:Ribosomal protein S2 [Hydrogenophaga sp. T4]